MMNSQEMSGTGAQDAHSGGSLSFRAVATPRAVIFDLGGTLVHWSDWDSGAEQKWAASYDHLVTQFADRKWPSRDAYVNAMHDAERDHWRRVDTEHWSGPPTVLVREAFDRLGVPVSGAELLGAMDGNAKAVAGWSAVDPEAGAVLRTVREQKYRLGLLSNTWWAADWHNADLAAHGLAEFLETLVYTSDLPHSKPHRSVFLEVAGRLGVEPPACVMVGDRQVDDISGALGVGMRAIWVRNDRPWPRSPLSATAEIDRLAEMTHNSRASSRSRGCAQTPSSEFTTSPMRPISGRWSRSARAPIWVGRPTASKRSGICSGKLS